MRILLSLMLILPLLGCDPDHKNKCEWYIVPDVDRIGQVDEGMIPVCARNFVVNKQDCRLQTTLAFAEKIYKKSFRYVDLKTKNAARPRTIDEIRFCE